MREPTEGVDYLIDQYAILGVAKDATPADMKKEWLAKQAHYHTDRFQTLAPELREQAKNRLQLINDAYKILSNTEKRKAYDAILASWEKPISEDGNPIVDLSASGFSFSHLTSNLASDADEHERMAEEIALQVSNFNPATYKFFRKKAKAKGGIPAELKPAYLEQLKSRELYVATREQFLWESVGVRNHYPAPRLTYCEQVEESLGEVTRQANAGVKQQMLLLAAGEQALLPPPEGMESSADAGAMLVHYQAKFGTHIQQQAESLKRFAAEREQLLNERFNISAEVTYHPEQRAYTKKLIIQVKSSGKSVWIPFEFKDNNRADGQVIKGIERAANLAGARKWISRGYSILSFNLDPDIDMNSQLERVLGMHAGKLAKKGK